MTTAAFQQLQYDFTRHIRDPQKNAKPEGIEERRMAIYRDLLFNNIQGFINSAFPVLHSLYEEKAWLALVRQFFANYRCQTPYFVEISQEFLVFLQNDYQANDNDPAFLSELAHYEWVELDLMLSKKTLSLDNVNPHGDLLAERPIISPLCTPLSYQWDVQHISPHYQPSQIPEQATYLIVYRNYDDEVKFIEANPVTARLIDLLQSEQNLSGAALLGKIATEMQHPQPEIIIQGGHQILLKLLQAGVLLGTANV
jgi:hypothetical protein